MIRFALSLWTFLSSRTLGTILIASWIFAYSLLAIWDTEAFARFSSLFREHPGLQVPYWLLTVNLSVRLFNRFFRRSGSPAWPVILRSVSPFGVILFLFGFGVSLGYKHAMVLPVGQGDAVSTPWGTHYEVLSITTGLKERILGGVEEDGGIFKYGPTMRLRSRNTVREVRAFPPSWWGCDLVHVLQFGIAPQFSLGRDGHIFRKEFQPVHLIPPPAADTVLLPPLPYEFIINLSPTKTYSKSTTVVSEYDLVHPLFHVRVMDNGQVIAEGTADPSVRFTDLDLSFPTWTPWVLMEIVRDPGLPFLIPGLFLALIGMPLWVVGRVWGVRHNKSMQ